MNRMEPSLTVEQLHAMVAALADRDQRSIRRDGDAAVAVGLDTLR